MAYGIGLVFDPRTEVHIREVWCRLSRQGFTTPLARPGCLPHISLILSETLHVDDLARDLEGFGHSSYRLEVRFSHVGVFTEPEIVLFYGLTPTDGLLCLHANVERIFRRWGSRHPRPFAIRYVGATLHVGWAAGCRSVLRSHRRRGCVTPTMGGRPGAAGDCPVRSITRRAVASLSLAGITCSLWQPSKRFAKGPFDRVTALQCSLSGFSLAGVFKPCYNSARVGRLTD